MDIKARTYPKKKQTPQEKYHQEKLNKRTQYLSIRLYTDTDKDLIQRLNSIDSDKSAFIKHVLRDFFSKH